MRGVCMVVGRHGCFGGRGKGEMDMGGRGKGEMDIGGIEH